MQNELFRKSALQTLSSPEQLDQLLKITSPRAWIALSAIGVIIFAALVWSLFGSLPTSVSGQGVIMRPGGVFNITSFGNGVITELGNFKTGEPVHKGQRLGRIAQPEMEQSVNAARKDLEQAEGEEKDVLALVRTEKPIQKSSFQLQQITQQQIIQAKEDKLRSLKKVEQQQSELLNDGLITRQKFEETRQAIYAGQIGIDNAKNMLQKLAVEKLQTTDQHEERLRTVRAKIAQAKNRLNQLQLQHQTAVDIVSPYDGVMVEMMAMQGDVVKNGQAIASVELDTKTLQAMIYIPPGSNAKRLLPGMAAQISPNNAKKERYGYLIGKISAVSEYPSTEAGMMAYFNNPLLVRELSKNGPPIAVLVDLVTDNATTSGYKWSSYAGNAVQVTSGSLCSGSFVVERKRPISLIIPLIKETIGL